jgi:hypothetical protein
LTFSIDGIFQDKPDTQGDLESRPPGKLIDIRLSDLIDDVFVSPGSPNDFFNAIKRITRQIGKPVHRSEIDSAAIF